MSGRQQDLKDYVVDKAKDLNEDEIVDHLLNQQFQRQVELQKQIILDEFQKDDFLNFSLNFYEGVTIKNQPLKNIILNEPLKKTTKDQLHLILQQNGFIIMNQEKQMKSLSNIFEIKVVFHSQFYDVVEILCQFGPYAKRYVVLNQSKESFRHQNKIVGFGSFGKIYTCLSDECDSQNVIKCLHYNQKEPHLLKNIIKQFFICDMMSALRIGPKILRNTGFDFIMFSNCLQFEMQKCLPLQSKNIQKDTKQNLFKLHLLQMVHFDIKPTNTMYSKTFGKNILIDFGICQILTDKWGQKSLSTFKGTYKYCSQQMKKLFMQKQIKFINTYRNDMEALQTSIIQIIKEGKIQQIFQKQTSNVIKKKQPFKNEIILSLKYHLYLNQFASSPTKQFRQFIKKLNFIKQIEILKLIVNQCLQFTQKMQFFAIINFANQFLWKNQITKSFQIWINVIISSKKAISNQQAKYNLKKKSNDYESFDIIYKILEKQEQYEQKNDQQNEVLTESKIKNIQYVLNNQNQLNKLNEQQKFVLFLKYCTFWKSKFSIKFQQKQKASKILANLIKTNSSSIKNKFYSNQYIPHLNLLNKGNKNIIFVYSYLLSYCIQGDFNDFKQNYMMLVIKDCIILGFQYFRFIKEYVIYFFQRLIVKRNNKLITLMTIQFMQLHFLTLNHLITTDEQNPQFYTDKYFFICSKFIIQRLVSFMTASIDNEKEKQFKQKIKIMEIFWQTLLNQEKVITPPLENYQKFNKDIHSIVQMIEKQFSHFHIKEIGTLSSIALSHLHQVLKQFNQIQRKSYQLKTSVYKHYNYEINKYYGFNFNSLKIQLIINQKQTQQALQKFDKKINCKQLSQYFFIVLRCRIGAAIDNTQLSQFQISLAFNSKGSPILNFYSLTLLKFNLERFDYQDKLPQITGKCYPRKHTLKLINKYMLFLFQSIDFMIRNGQNQKFLQCLTAFKAFYITNIRYIEKNIIYQGFRNVFKQLIKFNLNHYLTNFLMVCLLQLYSFYTLDYLRIRKTIFQNFLQMIKKNKRLVIQRDENLNGLIYNHFLELLTDNPYLQNQLLKLWQNLKLKTILCQDTLSIQSFPILSQVFMNTGNAKKYLQMLVIQTRQGFLFVRQSYFQIIIDDFKRCYQNKNMRQSNFQEIVKMLKKISGQKERIETKIILFLFLFYFQQELEKNHLYWKKSLISFCQTYEQFKNTNNTKINVIKIINQKICVYTLKFLKIQSKSYRKFFPLLKVLYISVDTRKWYQQKQFHFYEKYIKNLMKIPSSKNFIRELFDKKLTKYKEKSFGFSQIWSYFNDERNHQNISQISKLLEMQEKGKRNKEKQQQTLKLYHTRDYALVDMKLKQWKQNYKINQIIKYFDTTQISQDGNFRLEDITDGDVVERIQKSQEYRLCEQTIDIIDQILRLENQSLLQQIRDKNLSKQFI